MKSKPLIVSAHQPNFMPNLGYFHKMLKTDRFIVITNIQFEKQEGWQRRNKILTKNGDVWISLPVIGSQNQIIKDVKINNNYNWRKKNKNTLIQNYNKTKEKEFLKDLLELYDHEWDRLADFNFSIIKLVKETLDIGSELIFDEDVSGDKQELLIEICKKYNGKKYLSGIGAKSYMTEEYFNDLKENNLENEFIENPHLNYPYSIIHYILSYGKKSVKKLLESEKKLFK